MSAPSPDTVLARSDALTWRVLDGEAVILAPAAGVLHRLNGTGTRAWEMLDGRRTLAEIGEGLAAEFDIAADAAVHEVRGLAADLLAAALAELRDGR